MFKKKITGLLCALVVALSAVIPAYADPEVPLTDVVIHKMKVAQGTALEDHDGEEITDFTGTNLAGAEGLEGVVFEFWQIRDTATDAELDAIGALTNYDAIKSYFDANPGLVGGLTGELDPTDSNGMTTAHFLSEGTYIFAEQNADELNVTEYLGVPFMLSLPVTKANGTENFGIGAKALHVYPKNVVDSPDLELLKVNTENNPIGDATFEIRKWVEDRVDEGGNPLAPGYVKDTSLGNNGSITITDAGLTLQNIPAGKYQLVETVAPNGYLLDTRPVSFEVSAGQITATNGPNYTFQDGPLIKIKNEARPSIEKEEDAGGTSQVGETVNWSIKVSVPKDIETYTKFNVTDTIDTRLDFKGTASADGFQVKAADGTVLTAGTHYTVNYASNVLTVAFNPASIKDFEGQKITISYATSINDTAVMGSEIPNDAKLNFTNNTGTDTEDDPQGPVEPPTIPTVWTGGAQFKKVDGKDNTIMLPGAEFKISKNATGTDLLKWTQALIDANDTSKFVTPVVGADVVMKSQSDGVFEIKGLKGGYYWLVETKAPSLNGSQYNLLKTPESFSITKESYNGEIFIKVENNKGLQIPQTGGIGSLILTVGGITMMIVAAYFLKKGKRTNAD